MLWLTGLSGAGKSTIAIELEQQLFLKGYQTYVLDGDNIRFGLSADSASRRKTWRRTFAGSRGGEALRGCATRRHRFYLALSG